ncbi:MAG: helix-turn-helix transcriptional regulator [Eubacteriales bacterium]
MPRSARQKLKLLYLRDYLRDNTDEEHPASASDIIAYLSAQGISAERKSVYDDITALQSYGDDIIRIPGKNGGYFLASRIFEFPELELLTDAVQSSRFISEAKAKRLTEKLARFAGRLRPKLLRRQIYTEDGYRTENEAVYNSIDRLLEAIDGRKKVTFRYYEYLVENGRISRRFRRGGSLYTADPVAVVRSDDKCYLVAYEGDSLRHYRADKLSGLTVTDIPADPHPVPDMSAYLSSSFLMFGGEKQSVKLHCTGDHAGVIADRFGRNIPVLLDGRGGFYVTVQVLLSPQFYSWVFSFGGDIQITDPPAVRDEMLKMLETTKSRLKEEQK